MERKSGNLLAPVLFLCFRVSSSGVEMMRDEDEGCQQRRDFSHVSILGYP